MADDLSSLGDFAGTARLFPLPNLVLFPAVAQPLHVFEPRYRQLTADALAGDRLIAPVLLRPGWEDDYEGRPAVHDVACVGRVVADQQLPDGRYNLLLRGLSRVRLVEEVETGKLYRAARLEALADADPTPAAARRLRRMLGEFLGGWASLGEGVLEQYRKLLASELRLGTLCDVFAFTLPLEPATKQQLLEELRVEARAELLLAQVQAGQAAADGARPKFPPDFSAN